MPVLGLKPGRFVFSYTPSGDNSVLLYRKSSALANPTVGTDMMLCTLLEVFNRSTPTHGSGPVRVKSPKVRTSLRSWTPHHTFAYRVFSVL